jgi:predicted PurR-regulated permease PerM
VTGAGVVLTYLAGKLAYRIRDVLLMIAVAGFLTLILNPLVASLQRWGSGALLDLMPEERAAYCTRVARAISQVDFLPMIGGALD